MRTRSAEPPMPVSEAAYAAERARVDSAYRRMCAIIARPHNPAQARDAARELTGALQCATASVARELQAASLSEQPPPAPRRPRHRRHTSRGVPPPTRSLSAELVRLTQIGVWLRRTTMDDLGVQVPTAVQAGGYAAIGPHIAGLRVAGDDLALAGSPREPRIGVDLQVIVDGTCLSAGAAARAGRAESAAPDRVAS